MAEIQNDESFMSIFKVKETKMSVCDETELNYPISNSLTRELLLPFPPSDVVECVSSIVRNLLQKKRTYLNSQTEEISD